MKERKMLAVDQMTHTLLCGVASANDQTQQETVKALSHLYSIAADGIEEDLPGIDVKGPARIYKPAVWLFFKRGILSKDEARLIMEDLAYSNLPGDRVSMITSMVMSSNPRLVFEVSTTGHAIKEVIEHEGAGRS